MKRVWSALLAPLLCVLLLAGCPQKRVGGQQAGAAPGCPPSPLG